jgi:hypothetical protein
MTERCTLFLPTRAGLSRKRLQGLVGKQATVEGARGAFVLSYPTFSLALNAIPAGEVGDRLLQAQMFLVRLSSRGVDEKLQAVLDRMQETQAILDITIEPGHGRDGLSRQAIQGLTTAFEAMWLDGLMLYDQRGGLLHSPSVSIPPATGPGPTRRQLDRQERSHAEMRRRGAPIYSGVLVVDDDEEAEVRPAREAALRVWCMYAVVMRAEEAPLDFVHALIEGAGAWDAVSPEEEEFLREEEPPPERRGPFVWRLEAIEPLLWALNWLPQLDWPAGFCLVPRQVGILRSFHERPARFIDEATLRPVAELLDAQDLTLRQHWALRTCYLNHHVIPADLDWTGTAERMPVRGAPVAGAVAERHRALNWLLYFGGADWDDVDTPT